MILIVFEVVPGTQADLLRDLIVHATKDLTRGWLHDGPVAVYLPAACIRQVH